jgi:hypothetical protein
VLIDVTPSRHCQALPPSSSYRIKASCTHPSLGGEALAPSAAVGAPSKAATVIFIVRLSYLHIAGIPSTIFAATSE